MAGEIQLNGTTAVTESSGAITLNNVNSATNRSNLGLGTAATTAATDYIGTSRSITAGSGLSGGGDLSANRTLSVSFSADESAVKTAINASGSANIYACRAWINFNGDASTIGTGRNRGNCGAVSDHGTGDYTVNFTNAMPTADYAVSLSTNGTNGDAHNSYAAYFYDNSSRSASGVRIVTTSAGGTHLNNLVITVAIFC